MNFVITPAQKFPSTTIVHPTQYHGDPLQAGRRRPHPTSDEDLHVVLVEPCVEGDLVRNVPQPSSFEEFAHLALVEPVDVWHNVNMRIHDLRRLGELGEIEDNQ